MKKTGKLISAALAVVMLGAVAVAGVTVGKRLIPSKEAADIEQLFPAKGSRVSIVWNEELQEEQALYEEGQVYLPLDWVNENLNERFYWDEGEELLVYALPDKIVYAQPETMGDKGHLLLVKEDEVYLSAGLVNNYTNIRSVYFDNPAVHEKKEDDDRAKRIFINSDWGPLERATVKRDTEIRELGGVKSPVITEVLKGTGVTVLDEMETWSYVRTDTGFMGYMKNSKLKDRNQQMLQSAFQEPVYESQSLNERVSLVWHQVTSQEANKKFDEMFSAVEGVNVVSPTWFALTDNQGNFTSLANKDYVEKAHRKGMQVWALLDNFSDNVQTEVLLSSTATRKKLIENLIEEVEAYEIDGLNLDFESLKPEAGKHYIQFIRELSIACREKGIILSVDNYVPAAYTEFYNRKEQGIVADYVIVMCYDEHYAGGEKGTVASLAYVQNGVENTLKSVPAEKVIGAVPFYTRLWTVKDGKTTSKAMGMTAAKKWVEDNNVELTWLEEEGRYYGELKLEDGSMQYMWLEDKTSLELKVNAIDEAEVAGVACWKLGFEPDDIWEVVNP